MEVNRWINNFKSTEKGTQKKLDLSEFKQF